MHTRVWKMPLTSRLFVFVLSLPFVATGGYLAYAAATGKLVGEGGPVMPFIAGTALVLLFGWFMIQAIVAEKVTLVADAEGVHPAFLPKKYESLIRWDEIEDIAIAEQYLNSAKNRSLAIYLKQSRSFGPLFSGAEHGATAFVAGTMSDAGAASLYIPEKRMNEKAEIVRDTLLAMRSEHTGHA